MPKVVKGTIQPRSKHPWREYFDGRQRVFAQGKDFTSPKAFVSSVHQAASRLGVKAVTVRVGKDIRMQSVTKLAQLKSKSKTKRSSAPAPRVAKRKAPTRRVKKAAAEATPAGADA